MIKRWGSVFRTNGISLELGVAARLWDWQLPSAHAAAASCHTLCSRIVVAQLHCCCCRAAVFATPFEQPEAHNKVGSTEGHCVLLQGLRHIGRQG